MHINACAALLLSVIMLSMSACGGEQEKGHEDCRTCADVLTSAKVGQPMCAVGADCDPDPGLDPWYGYCEANDSTCLASIPAAMAVEVRVINRWPSADELSVEFSYWRGSTHYQSTLLLGTMLDQSQMARSSRFLPLEAGHAVDFRVRRRYSGYVSPWYTTVVPPTGYFVWRFDFTNQYYTQECSGPCLTTMWEV